jgi:hypothetical protein
MTQMRGKPEPRTTISLQSNWAIHDDPFEPIQLTTLNENALCQSLVCAIH